MVGREMDVEYLNRFLGHLWPGMSAILQAEVTHRAFKEIKQQSARMSRRRTQLDLTALPQVAAHGQEGLRIRIPGSGASRFSTLIYPLPWFPVPRIRADVDILVDVTVTADSDPDTQITATVHSNVLGSLADRFVNWKEKVERSFTGEDLEREIGYFSAARYAPSEVPAIPEPERVYPARPALKGAVNLILVPESFDHGDLSRFDQMVEAAVKILSQPDESHANEPFYSFKTAIDVWTIKPEQSPEGDHVMGSFVDPRGHRRVALANLARLAAIGRKAERTGTGVSVLVFVVNPEASRFGGRRPTAMSLGNVIMQPLQSTPEEDAYLLLHELGHTGLGRLGDEYVLRSRSEERYLGQSPGATNLTADQSLRKWQRWMDSPSQWPAWDDQPITGAEGAGYFGSGIWRPAERCAMRHSKDGVPFCAICRETLTKGIRRALSEDRVLLRVDYPSGNHEYLQAVTNDSGAMTQQIVMPSGQPVELSVMPVAASMPEPWKVTATTSGDDDVQVNLEDTPQSGLPMPRYQFTIPASPGDRLTIKIESQCPFTPWDQIPQWTIELRCVSGHDG